MSLIDDAVECGATRAEPGQAYAHHGEVTAHLTERDLRRLREKWLAEFRERAAKRLKEEAKAWRKCGADISAEVTRDAEKIIRALPLDKAAT